VDATKTRDDDARRRRTTTDDAMAKYYGDIAKAAKGASIGRPTDRSKSRSISRFDDDVPLDARVRFDLI
jgi:hypothetical protein